MLVLTRKLGEVVQVGDSIQVRVLEVKGKTIRLGFSAPTTIKIVRQELIEKDRAKEAKSA